MPICATYHELTQHKKNKILYGVYKQHILNTSLDFIS